MENLMVGTHKYSSSKWVKNFPLVGDYVCENCKKIYIDQEIRKHQCPDCGEWTVRLDGNS